MSGEYRHIEIMLSVPGPDHLPLKDGEQMYADDVVSELRDVVSAAVDAWYEERGKELLRCEPIL